MSRYSKDQVNRRNSKLLLTLLAATGYILLLAQITLAAQQVIPAQDAGQTEQANPLDSRTGIVSVKLERGGKVTLGNRTIGRITVIGWDRDIIEAKSTSERGVEAVRFRIDEESSGKKVWLKADYADNEELAARTSGPALSPPIASPSPEPTVTPKPVITPGQIPTIPLSPASPGPVKPAMFDSLPNVVHLEVKLPRYAEIDVIEVNRSDVEVTGVETPIVVKGNRSTVKLTRVGAVEVRTRSGNVEVENASGLVDVITASGAITVRNASSDVRALSISGPVEIQCARGRIDVGNTEGLITLDSISGDVDANTTNSNIRFTGAIREDGRYHLKSMSGTVEMALRPNAPGFTAALSSYRGGIQSDFSLKSKEVPHHSAVNQRLIGRYGNGKAQITLDSFDGVVKLSKLAAGAIKECR